jgi:hypothetical protein
MKAGLRSSHESIEFGLRLSIHVRGAESPRDYDNDNLLYHLTHTLSVTIFTWLCSHSVRVFRFGQHMRHSLSSLTT